MSDQKRSYIHERPDPKMNDPVDRAKDVVRRLSAEVVKEVDDPLAIALQHIHVLLAEIDRLREQNRELREALSNLDDTLASYLCVVAPGGQSIRASNPEDFDAIEPDVARVWRDARAALAKTGGE